MQIDNVDETFKQNEYLQLQISSYNITFFVTHAL